MRYGHVQNWGGAAAGLKQARAGSAGARAEPGQAVVEAVTGPPWSAARIAAVEQLFGPGFTGPGGAPETLSLARPLGLGGASRLMLIGGGLGGPALAIARHFGARVASCEAETALRELALARREAGADGAAAGRVRHLPWPPAPREMGPVQAVLSLEALRGGPAETLLARLRAALRPPAQVVLTELVGGAAPPEDREFVAWCHLARRGTVLPTGGELTGLFLAHGLAVQAVEDISARHLSMTLAAWHEALRQCERQDAAGERPSAAAGAALLQESELWLLRLRLMRRLGLKLLRWHAVLH